MPFDIFCMIINDYEVLHYSFVVIINNILFLFFKYDNDYIIDINCKSKLVLKIAFMFFLQKKQINNNNNNLV